MKNHVLDMLMYFIISSNLIGELYVQAQRMFDDQRYKRLLAIIGLAIKQTLTKSDNCEAEPVSVL